MQKSVGNVFIKESFIPCRRKEGIIMTGLMLVGIALVWFAGAYLIYGRWLTKTWGIDPKAKTPAVRKNDGGDYSPAI